LTRKILGEEDLLARRIDLLRAGRTPLRFPNTEPSLRQTESSGMQPRRGSSLYPRQNPEVNEFVEAVRLLEDHQDDLDKYKETHDLN